MSGGAKPGVRLVPVAAADDGLRLDRWFKEHVPELGFGRLQKLLRTGQIRLDGKRAQAKTRVETGQEIRIPPMSDVTPAAPKPKALAAKVTDADRTMLEQAVLWRNEEVIFIDKPAGLAVQGGSGTERHLDGMLDVFTAPGGERPRLVHRLDKETSGVLALARTRAAARWLTQAFKHKDAQKTYVAVLTGLPPENVGEVRIPLAKSGPKGQEKMRPADPGDGQHAVTRYRVLDRLGTEACLCALEPVTGRTHQLRAHMGALGCPILGDGKYGAKLQPWAQEAPKRLYLHAKEITLAAPTGGTLHAVSPLPGEFEALNRLTGMTF